jgi:hypothetical protein
MRIPESNMTLASQWALMRSDQPSASALGTGADPAPKAVVPTASQLDTDRDGWLDEDDIPYDQLMRLARMAEEYAELGGIRLGAAAVTQPLDEAAVKPPASTAGTTRPAEPEPQPEQHGRAPQIDLLA